MFPNDASPAAIETTYRNRFIEGFTQQFQQFDSRLLPHVEMERQASEFDYYHRIGIADEMTEDTTRYGDNPTSEVDFDRRRLALRDYELGKYIDPKDLIRVVNDPTNSITLAMQASAFRKMDDIIVDAFFGNAYTGKSGGTTVAWVGSEANAKDAAGDDLISVGEYSKGHSNPITTAGTFQLISGNYEGIHVGVQYDGTGSGTTDTGFTLAKMKGPRQTMLRLEALRQDEMLTAFLTAKQFDDLLGIDEVINSDYATRKALAEGSTTTFMGYRFVHAERLPTDSEGNRRCLIFKPMALKMAIGTSLGVDIWRDTAKKRIPYIYFNMAAGATRMWGEVACEVVCAE